MRLDVGGIAKGYAADQALAVLRAQGIDCALVAASGDIAIGDPPPGQPGWRVGITPIGSRSNSIVRTLILSNAGISTSGDAEQFIEIDGTRYSHIVSPFTGLGLTERIQVTVVSTNATTTDSLATAVSVLGAKRGLKLIESMPLTAALITTFQDGAPRVVPSVRFKRLPQETSPAERPSHTVQ
jgi:FAD:protein FMN transferase